MGEWALVRVRGTHPDAIGMAISYKIAMYYFDFEMEEHIRTTYNMLLAHADSSVIFGSAAELQDNSKWSKMYTAIPGATIYPQRFCVYFAIHLVETERAKPSIFPVDMVDEKNYELIGDVLLVDDPTTRDKLFGNRIGQIEINIFSPYDRAMNDA